VTDRELVRNLTKLGCLISFNKNLNLWSIAIDDALVYLKPEDAESFTKKDLDRFLAGTLMQLMQTGGHSGKITLH
jgi:hypothetical protein